MADRELQWEDGEGASAPAIWERLAAADRFLLGAIETTEEAPVVLDLPWRIEGDTSSSSSVYVSEINDTAAVALRGSLPGVRVGDDEGTGYVVARDTDGKLIFVPDAGFIGTTQFTLTIADPNGCERLLVATVNVKPSSDTPTEITFANGSQQASVVAGITATIVGALSLSGAQDVPLPDVLVFEGGENSPSTRFAVSGGRLHLLQPLDTVLSGPIQLRLDAYDDAFVFASSELAVEILSSSAASTGNFVDGGALCLAYDVEADGKSHAMDGFHFYLANDDMPFDHGAAEFAEVAFEPVYPAPAVGDEAIAVDLPATADPGGDQGI